ncbi:DNA methylase [Gordonia phage RedWattleHog]|uniref:DNA methyltransferase n=1 Tax=Gordonia phage Stormageddon TaxID=2656541 RepID=A0A649VRD3_9CAUD|nr:DNA methyltransferase [Gordonia phage Stormageddon]QGJ95067.1 DNA methyltransferase [Gordonia phage Stormageddon]QLF83709.1 DNA methylase [Gordonia phage RedWattleHog]
MSEETATITPSATGHHEVNHPSELNLAKKNPRKGDVDIIASSLRANSQYKPVTVNRGTYTGRPMEVLAGNHTVKAIRNLAEKYPDDERWQRVDCWVIDVDDDRANRIVLADNRTADLGGYDEDVLLDLLQDVTSLEGTGYSAEDLAALQQDLQPNEPKADPDDAPPLPEFTARCEVGQVWKLGPHRLAVGSSTDEALMDRLMASMGCEGIDGLLTDPPYGVSYVGAKDMSIENDELRDDALQELVQAALANGERYMPPGTPWYIFGPSNEQQMSFRLALKALGWLVRSECVWVKNALVLGRGDYQPKHESCLTGGDDPDTDGWDEEPPPPEGHDVALYGWKHGAAHRWLGDRKQTTVWEHPKPRSSADHPTMKPVDLFAAILANSVQPGGIVLDLFCGSGTTVAAAFLTGRKAATFELDPRYADVILTRWKNISGEDPELDETV